MQKSLWTLLILLSILNVPCVGQGPATSPARSLLVFPVISEIKVIKIRDKLETDTNLSNYVRNEIVNQVKTIVPDSINATLLKNQEFRLKEIYKCLNDVVKIVESKFKPKTIKAPELLLQLLETTGSDLGLCIFDRGFIRTDENQSKEYTKSVELNVLSLGVYSLFPNKSFSTMICFVVDRKQKTLSFYDKSTWREGNPTETVVIKSQLHRLLMSYFLKQG